jgi:hypothetical protein
MAHAAQIRRQNGQYISNHHCECSPTALRGIDLNLPVVFNELIVERRVNAVAQSLGITQLALSNALARLRWHLGDEFFLRPLKEMPPAHTRSCSR